MGLKRNQDADKERKILYAFSQSILKSGDGKSSATAWFAVDMWEEFFLMDVFLEVQLKEHHTLKQGGHYYDIVAVTNKKGKNQILWFNTDTDVEMLGRIGDEAVAQHAAEKK
jgi:hypothetical protein